MRRLYFTSLVVLTLLLSSSAWALDDFYQITQSVRALGMGGAFYGLSDDEYALFYNPAGLANYRGGPEAKLAFGAQVSDGFFSAINEYPTLTKGHQQVGDIVNALQSLSGQPVYVEPNVMPVYYLQKDFAIGLLLADTKVQLGLLGRDFDTSVDFTAIMDSGIVVGYARDLTDDLHVGLNAKGIYRVGGEKTYTVLDIAQQGGLNIDPTTLGGGGFGVDFDLGAIYDVHGLPFGIKNQIGLTLNNLLASDFPIARIANAGAPPGLDRTISLGFHSVLPGYGIIDNVHLLLDLQQYYLGGEVDPNLGAPVGDFFKHVDFGAEAPMWGGVFVLRAGFHQGDIAAGFGVRTRYFDLDFATYEEELFLNVDKLNSRRYALRIAFGYGSPPPPPIYPEPAPVKEPIPVKIDVKPEARPGNTKPPIPTPPTPTVIDPSAPSAAPLSTPPPPPAHGI